MPVKKQNKKQNTEPHKYYGLIFAVITILLFITLCWYAYIYFVEQSTNKGIVHIKADRSPFKVIPEDPGGMVVKYTGKKVFDKITGASEDLTSGIKIIKEESPVSKEEIEKIIVENSSLGEEEYRTAAKTILNPILKMAKNKDVVKKEEEVKTFDDLIEIVNSKEVRRDEKVVDKDEKENIAVINDAFKSITQKVSGKKGEEKLKEKSGESRQRLSNGNVKITLKPKTLLTSPNENILSNAKVKSEKDKDTGKSKTTITFDRAPKSLIKNKRVKKMSSSKTAPGFYVQISSHTKLSDLETAWSLFKNKFSTIIGGKRKNVTEADIKGTRFYRLSFGPFKTKQQSQSTCDSIKVKGRDCLIKYY